jgi:2Fe-2S ferredoxin
MPIIKVLPHPDYCPGGAVITAQVGDSICESLLEHGIEIEHACEMSARLHHLPRHRAPGLRFAR